MGGQLPPPSYPLLIDTTLKCSVSHLRSLAYNKVHVYILFPSSKYADYNDHTIQLNKGYCYIISKIKENQNVTNVYPVVNIFQHRDKVW